MKHFYKNLYTRFKGLLPFIIFFFIIYNIEIVRELVFYNGLFQLALFIFITCIPAYLTKRMSYVDIAWPWGLVLIGVLVLILGEGYQPRILLIASMYLFSGLRMGIGAIVLLKKGHLDIELSRYKYQRKRKKTSFAIERRR